MSTKALASPSSALALPEATTLERSAACVMAAGYRLVPLLRPVGPWEILGVSPHGLLLVAVVEQWPSGLGAIYGMPAGWPHFTRRLLHRWPPGAAWPETMAL